MRIPVAGGGWPSILYTLKKARASGGFVRMIRALHTRNACKTCALGMGGQRGGMVNEFGRFPEVCKKSVQAMAADLQGRIREGFFEEFGFDKLARFTPRELEAAGRLVDPLIADGAAGDKGYRPISWEEAIQRTADAMKSARTGAPGGDPAAFFYFSGRSSNEAAYLLQLLARVYGTNNVNNCSFFCHQASGVALRSVIGSGTATVALEDLQEHDGADLLFLIGANPASNHPRLMRTIVDLRRRGGKVIVINPLKELGLVRFKVPSDVRSMLAPRGSQVADFYVQPHIGGDLALLAGMAKSLMEPDRKAIDTQYLADHTAGFDDFRSAIDALSWDQVESASGVSRAEIRKIVDLYAASRKTVFAWTMGITHHVHGVNNVRMIAAVAMLRGMVGKPGAGLLPLRGHSNVQGVGSMGVEPRLKPEVFDAIEQTFNLKLPKAPGMDTQACIDAAAAGKIRFAWHLGGNLLGSSPDATAAERALRSIDTTVFLSTTLNTGHIHGRGKTSIILPVLARDEESQSTTQESMFSYVRLSAGGLARHTGRFGTPLSETDIIASVFKQVLGPRIAGTNLDVDAMSRHDAIRDAISRTIPGYEPIARIKGDGTNKSSQQGEFHIAGRLLRSPAFKTENGRAVFFPVPPLPKPAPPGSLRLMTIRSEGQFNTVVYEDHDVYRGQDRRDVIMMNAADMAALGLKPDDVVAVTSRSGHMDSLLVREIDIRPGNAAMYYPEANVLVPPDTDPESRTPAFKGVEIRVEKRVRLLVRP